MKTISDLFQVLLSLPGALGFIASALLVLVVLQLWKSGAEISGFAWLCLKWLYRRLVRLSVWRVAFVCIAAVPVFFLRFTVIEKLQYLEQWAQPAYVTGDTSAHALAIYEAELEKHCDTYEVAIVKRRTREIAGKVGCSPLALFEVYYSECGLNPFQIRKDGVAAGIIQFTSAGAAGITTLPAVKAACKDRDIEKIMDWTEAYMVRASAGRPLGDAAGVYVAVFAPGFIGAAEGQVLYQGWGNPAYSLNSCFDGYYLDGKGRIFRGADVCDGKITIGELRLHLEAKKARLLNSKKKI